MGKKNAARDTDVSVDLYQDAFIDQDVLMALEASGYDDVIIDAKIKQISKVKQDSDVDVSGDAANAAGADIDVYQDTDIDQNLDLKIKVKEKGDDLIIKIKAMEKSKLSQDTDVDIDLLVDPQAPDTASDVLHRLGYRNLSAPRGVDDIGGVVHGSTWLGKARDVDYGVQLDVHRWLPGARAAPAAAGDNRH